MQHENISAQLLPISISATDAQLTQAQIELILVSLMVHSETFKEPLNLSKAIYQSDYFFDGFFGFKNPFDKRLIVFDTSEHTESHFGPLIDQLLKLHSDLSLNN